MAKAGREDIRRLFRTDRQGDDLVNREALFAKLNRLLDGEFVEGVHHEFDPFGIDPRSIRERFDRRGRVRHLFDQRQDSHAAMASAERSG
jgi:hypothetical protein